MRNKITQITFFNTFLLFSVVCQLMFIVINLLGATDGINYAMYINNYIIGFLIIACLISRGGTSQFLAFSFFGCYMLFLMGQKPFEPEYDVYLTFARVHLDTSQYYLFSCILFIGLACTYYSYIYWYRKSPRVEKVELADNSVNYAVLKPFLSAILWITLPCAFYMQAKIVLVRSSMAYTSGYLMNVDVPVIIKIGYYIYSTVVLLYLALRPSKLQLYFTLGTYVIIEGGLQLFQGRRALFASTILFVIWYLLKYNGSVKIQRKYVLRIIVALVGMVVLFYVVEQSRSDSNVSLTLKLVSRFLISTGGSDSVIANTIFRKKDFPASGVAYLFDPLINNPVGNAITGKTSSAQGMTYLEQHNSFSHWISYMTEPSLYKSGHGMGSCYLAEVYLAFGVIGVIIISIIIGWFIHKLNYIKFNSNLFRTGLVFFMVRRLFTLPRDGLFSWASGLIYLLFTYLLIYPFYYRWCRSSTWIKNK